MPRIFFKTCASYVLQERSNGGAQGVPLKKLFASKIQTNNKNLSKTPKKYFLTPIENFSGYSSDVLANDKALFVFTSKSEVINYIHFYILVLFIMKDFILQKSFQVLQKKCVLLH